MSLLSEVAVPRFKTGYLCYLKLQFLVFRLSVIENKQIKSENEGPKVIASYSGCPRYFAVFPMLIESCSFFRLNVFVIEGCSSSRI